MISTQTMILWVFVICAIGAWILQRHEKRKRRAFIERERERWTDLKWPILTTWVFDSKVERIPPIARAAQPPIIKNNVPVFIITLKKVLIIKLYNVKSFVFSLWCDYNQSLLPRVINEDNYWSNLSVSLPRYMSILVLSSILLSISNIFSGIITLLAFFQSSFPTKF
jgi:hypothetical protein